MSTEAPNRMVEFLKSIEKILISHGLNLDNPYLNSVQKLEEVRETIIGKYKENQIMRGEYIRTLFEINKLTRVLAYR